MPEGVALLLLACFGASAGSGPTTLVTFDNGEFNAPLYTPRWNGKWKQPSVAQEIATSIARVAGENPRVYTYLPPGQGEARPGGAFRVVPVRPGCEGPAFRPDDVCWCSPADNCWGDLQPNWYPAASTNLYLSANQVRTFAREEGAGPRIEVHFTDLFEEDPSAAEKPSDSDRCVTRDGVKRAAQAVLTLGENESLDHLAVGVLKATIAAPPPGSSWGNTYALVPDGATCHRGVKTGTWDAARGPITWTMGVLVIGVDTTPHHAAVRALLDGMVAQLDADAFEFDLVTLREPPGFLEVSQVIDRSTARSFSVPSAAASGVACADVVGEGLFTSDGVPLPGITVVGACDGSAEIAFDDRALVRAFADQAGADPGVEGIIVDGGLTLRGDAGSVARAFHGLSASSGDRPLPLWSALGEALAIDAPEAPSRAWRAWSQRVEIRDLRVVGLDTRPWWVAAFAGAVLSFLVSFVCVAVVSNVQARRAIRRRWESAHAGDPLVARPLAVVIGLAQQDVARRWWIRVIFAAGVGSVVFFAVAWSVLRIHRVLLG